jgi:TrmH family RNA methyltransferase
MLTLASTPNRDSMKITQVDMSGGVVCVVGNEGNGVTTEAMNACKTTVTIPMDGRAESLNAATAAAILVWEMVRK